jgi:hypothetical protein
MAIGGLEFSVVVFYYVFPFFGKEAADNKFAYFLSQYHNYR